MIKNYKTHIKLTPKTGCSHEPYVLLAGALRRKFTGLARPALIAVGGPGGIGKSTFAHNLARELGLAVVLGLDDYKSPRNVREFTEYGAESKNWADVHIHCDSDYTLTLDAVCSKVAAFLVEDVKV